MEESPKVDEMAAAAAQAPPHTPVAGAPPSLSEVKLVLQPVSGSVGRSDTGDYVLEFAAIAEVRVQVLLPEDAKKAIQRGFVGVDVATPADMEREVSAAGGVILKR